MSSGSIKDSNAIRKPFDISHIESLSSSSTVAYTSLKDILPPTPSPPTTVISPTNNSSWQEIPIKNPLVKHAAWAYLQPMSTPQESDDDDKDLLRRISRKCCPGGGFGCLEYYGQVVWENVKRCFTWTVMSKRGEEEEDHYDCYPPKPRGGDGEEEYYDMITTTMRRRWRMNTTSMTITLMTETKLTDSIDYYGLTGR